MKYTDPYNIAVIWLQKNQPRQGKKTFRNKSGLIYHPDYFEIERLVRQYRLSIYAQQDLEAYLINHYIMNISVTK